jgi:hypothetical protein
VTEKESDERTKSNDDRKPEVNRTKRQMTEKKRKLVTFESVGREVTSGTSVCRIRTESDESGKEQLKWSSCVSAGLVMVTVELKGKHELHRMTLIMVAGSRTS